MAKFRVRIEPTRAGNFQIRYFNKGDVAGRDGTVRTVDKNERAIIDGKEYVGRNIANKYRDKALRETHLTNLGETNPNEAVQPLIDQWIQEDENAGKSASTIAHHRSSLRAFMAENPVQVLEDLSRPLMQAWLAYMRKEGFQPWTIDGRLSDTRTFCNWLVSLGKIAKSPFEKPKNMPNKKVGNLVPKRKKAAPKFYTAGEYKALSDNLLLIDRYAQLACEIMHSAGCRKEEVVGRLGLSRTSDRIMWEDIIWHKGGGADLFIRPELVKTNEGRVIPLDPGVIAMLGSRKKGPIIPITRCQLDHFFIRAREKAGLTAFRETWKGKKYLFDIHGLRHTFAKNYLQRGVGNLASLRILMGHATIVSTQIYSAFEKAYFREGIDRAYEARLVEERLASEAIIPLAVAGELQVNLIKQTIQPHTLASTGELIKQ